MLLLCPRIFPRIVQFHLVREVLEIDVDLYYLLLRLTGNRNEIVGVLWLTGPALHESIGEDGLRVYDPLAADCLFGQGISFYPSVHPEFLSKGGDLAIDIVDRCNDYHWEHIHRVENRMVLIRDRMPFYFERTGAYNEPAIAVVMHFSVK